MQVEEIAQRFERRKDFQLIDAAPIALPIYLLTLECVCSVHRPFPPIALFVMKAISEGLTVEGQIAAFLGIELKLVDLVVTQLQVEGYALKHVESAQLSISQQGQRILSDERVHVPQEEVLTVAFDGLTRKPVWLSGEQLRRPSEIDRASTIEIRPYPGAVPELEDLRISEVAQILRKQYGGAEEFGRDLLSILRIGRRAKVFREAVGLAYRATRGPDVQFAFVVDGVPNTQLETIFSERGGPKKMGFIKALDESGVERNIRRHLGPQVISLLPDEADLRAKRQLLAAARLGLDVAQRRLEADPSAEKSTNVKESKRRYEDADRELRSFSARPIAVYELSVLLDDALTSANRRLMISVSTNCRSTLSRDSFRKIERLLKRKVDVQIVELVRPTNVGEPKSSAIWEELVRLKTTYHSLSIVESKRRGFFFLVKDSQYAVVANRPALGGVSRARMFHHFSGYLLQRADLIQAYIDHLAHLGSGIAGDDEN